MRGATREPIKLFVSHISDEAEMARLLHRQLEEDFIGQVKFFTSSDVGSISAGEEWLTAIHEALEESAAVLVLCSKVSVTRPWVQFELGSAWMKGTRIIPVCHSGMEPRDLPMPLAQLQSVQLGTQVGLDRLYQAVVEVLEWPKVPQPKDQDRFLADVQALESRFRDPVQQFERYVDVIVPRPGMLEDNTLDDSTKIESNAVSMELFGLIGTSGRTWKDICNAARRTPDTRWLTQLQDCIYKASRNEVFRPVQAVFHGERASYQPQLAKKEMHPDGSCRFHVHFVETTVAPLTEVQNDFGLLATLLRLGLRFRYEVVEHFQRSFKSAKMKPQKQQAAEMERILSLLRCSIEVIENDALSRGAQNFDPDAINALFEDDAEQQEMAAMQSIWADTRAEIFRDEPPLTCKEIEDAIARLRDMNYRFMCLATKRYNEMICDRWESPRAVRASAA